MVQRTRTSRTRPGKGADSSPYWDWVRRHTRGQHEPGDSQVQFIEPPQANPDVLDDTAAMYPEASDDVVFKADLIREAVAMLTPKERKAIKLLEQDMTFEKAAKKMRVKVGTFQVYVERARKKVQDYVLKNADGGI